MAARTLPAVLRRPRPWAASRKWVKSRSSSARGSSSTLRIDELQLVAGALRERRARLRAHADPVDGARHRAACRWSRWRSRSPRACRPSINGSSTCSIGSPPVQHDEGRRAAISAPGAAAGSAPAHRRRRICRHPDRRCRRNRCRRNCRSRSRGQPRGRTTDCSRQSGRTRPAARPARLRLAA